MEIRRVVLGILNILACVNMLVLFGISSSWARSVSVVFTWCLPLLIAAVAALVGGIAILKWKELGCAVSGLIIAGLGWFYFLALLWIKAWTMS